MSDSISELTTQIQTFVNARDWRKFHNAKDLAVAIAAEAGDGFTGADSGAGLSSGLGVAGGGVPLASG